MPAFIIRTNVLKEQFPADFISEATRTLAESLGKPEKYLCLVIEPGLWMSFGGTEEPCALCSLISIGKLGEEENVSHSKKIMEYLNRVLGIKPDRMYLSFQDIPRADMGYNGTTFAAILAASSK